MQLVIEQEAGLTEKRSDLLELRNRTAAEDRTQKEPEECSFWLNEKRGKM